VGGMEGMWGGGGGSAVSSTPPSSSLAGARPRPRISITPGPREAQDVHPPPHLPRRQLSCP